MTWSEFWTPTRSQEIAVDYQWWFIVASFAYLPVIFGMKWYMKDRKPMNLKREAFAWNMFLSIFSFIGMFMLVPRLGFSGLKRTIYPVDQMDAISRSIIAIFAHTKVVEFGDTVFLALRKKPLIFLHVYHHFSVALCTWQSQYVNAGIVHNYVAMNITIHSFMYLYYALAIVIPRHPVLRAVRPYITIAQLTQMFAGLFFATRAYLDPALPEAWTGNAVLAMCIYTSYAYLFADFYVRNYTKNVSSKMALSIGTVYCLAAAGCLQLYKYGLFSRVFLEVLALYGVSTAVYLATAQSKRSWASMLHRLINGWLWVGSESKKAEESKDKKGVSFIMSLAKGVSTAVASRLVLSTVLCGMAAVYYSFKVHNDMFLGITVFCCLRWVIELHTASRLKPSPEVVSERCL